MKNENCSPDFLLLVFSVRGAWRRRLRSTVNSPKLRQLSRITTRRKTSTASPNNAGDNGIGWGSSIEVGRLARAAEDALRHGNPGAAADYAQRAVKAAPQDGKLWFLLGYTSRLAGRYQTSLDAYQHGLQMSPGNADGMSGLAQTYARMGRTDDAKRLLMQVISANPKRTNDLLVVGELFMQTGDTQQGIDLSAARRSPAAQRARRVDAGHRLSEAEAAGEGQADARSGQEALRPTTSRFSGRWPTTIARSTTTKRPSPL